MTMGDNISPAKSSSSSSSSRSPSPPPPPPQPQPLQPPQRNRKLLFKKPMVRPPKRRVLSHWKAISLFGKKTSSPKKIFKDDDMDNTTMSQLCGTSGHEELKSPAMVRAIQPSSKPSGSSGHGKLKSPAMDRAIPSSSKRSGSSGHGKLKSPAMDRAIQSSSKRSGSSGHGKLKSPAMDRAIQSSSKRSGSSGHGKLKSPAMDRAIQSSSKRSGSSGHGEVQSPAMDRAKQIQEDLGDKFPSFVKCMYNSHVNVGFLLSLNRSFCDDHLGKLDMTIFLVGEKKKKYKTKYLSRYPGLSGGWKGFSQAHKLAEGDVLVFQLTKDQEFKVYIVRASETAEANAAVSLLNLQSQEKTLENTHCENGFEDVNNAEMIAGEDMWGEGKASDSDHVAEGTTLQLDDFDSFSIIVDGLAMDETDIPINLRYLYYNLCVNQKSFLHDDLVKGLDSKLAARIIIETVTIADAIRPANLSVSLDRLQSWDRMLKGFEYMGMKVGFLCKRIKELECLFYEQHEIIGPKKREQNQLEKKIRLHESKQLKMYEAKNVLDDEVDAVIVQNSSLEVALTNAAGAF